MSDFIHFLNVNNSVKISSVSFNPNSVFSKPLKEDSVSNFSGINEFYQNRFLEQEKYNGNIYISVVSSGNYPLISYSNANFNVRDIKNFKTYSGTLNLDLLINDNYIPDFSGLTINSSSTNLSSTGHNFVKVGDRFTVNIYNVSGAIGLEGAILGGY